MIVKLKSTNEVLEVIPWHETGSLKYKRVDKLEDDTYYDWDDFEPLAVSLSKAKAETETATNTAVKIKIKPVVTAKMTVNKLEEKRN